MACKTTPLYNTILIAFFLIYYLTILICAFITDLLALQTSETLLSNGPHLLKRFTPLPSKALQELDLVPKYILIKSQDVINTLESYFVEVRDCFTMKYFKFCMFALKPLFSLLPDIRINDTKCCGFTWRSAWKMLVCAVWCFTAWYSKFKISCFEGFLENHVSILLFWPNCKSQQLKMVTF